MLRNRVQPAATIDLKITKETLLVPVMVTAFIKILKRLSKDKPQKSKILSIICQNYKV